jgi:hypothetical protein
MEAPWEVEMSRSQFKASLGKKLVISYLNKPGMAVHTCNSSYAGGR